MNQGNWKKLKVGDKIKIGKKSSEYCGLEEDEIIELIEGEFEYDNGLYEEIQTAPSIWNEEDGEFDSIFHLFGNDLDGFLDSKVLKE